MSEPLPGYVHPSATAYRDGCRCAKCRARNKAARIHRETYGPGLVAADPVRSHLRALLDEGFSHTQISDLAGVTPSVVTSLFDPRHQRRRLQRTSADALLKVTRSAILQSAMPTSMVPTVGALRRVRALQRIGWTLRDLTATDAEYFRLQRVIRERRPSIEAQHHRWIAGIYDSYWDMDGGNTRVRLRAQRRKWAPPMAWDDDELDDPDALPWTGDKPPKPQLKTNPARRAMYDQGLSDRAIARSEGVTPDAIRYWRITNKLPSNCDSKTVAALGKEGDNRYALWQQGLGDRDIAAAVGRHHDVIRRWRTKHGLEPGNRRAG